MYQVDLQRNLDPKLLLYIFEDYTRGDKLGPIVGPHPDEVHRCEKSKEAHEKKMRRLHILHKYKVREVVAFSILFVFLSIAGVMLYAIEVELPAKEARMAQIEEEYEFVLWLESEANIETASNDCVSNEALSYYDCFYEVVQQELDGKQLNVKTIEKMISVGVGLIYSMSEEERLKRDMDMPKELRVPAQLRSEVTISKDMNILSWYLFNLEEISRVETYTVLGYLEKHKVFNRIHSIAMKKVALIDGRIGSMPETYKSYQDDFLALKSKVESFEGSIYSVSK